MHGIGKPAEGPGDVQYIPGTLRTEVDGSTYRLTLQAPQSMKNHPEFEKVIWDECLRRAHEAGHMPVGSILVTTENIDPEKPEALKEGEAMSVAEYARPTFAFLGGTDVPIMKVTAEVMLGLSL